MFTGTHPYGGNTSFWSFRPSHRPRLTCSVFRHPTLYLFSYTLRWVNLGTPIIRETKNSPHSTLPWSPKTCFLTLPDRFKNCDIKTVNTLISYVHLHSCGKICWAWVRSKKDGDTSCSYGEKVHPIDFKSRFHWVFKMFQPQSRRSSRCNRLRFCEMGYGDRETRKSTCHLQCLIVPYPLY